MKLPTVSPAQRRALLDATSAGQVSGTDGTLAVLRRLGLVSGVEPVRYRPGRSVGTVTDLGRAVRAKHAPEGWT